MNERNYVRSVLMSIPFFAFLGSSQFVFSMCAGPSLNFWPSGKTVSANSIFVIEEYMSQELIEGLGKKYPIYLQSGNEIIPLFVSEICHGTFWVSQALLYPEKHLSPGKTYQICIDNFQNDDNFFSFQKEGEFGKPQFQEWLVTEKPDKTIPLLFHKPVETSKWVRNLGCGPEKVVKFKLTTFDQSDILVRASVIRNSTGEINCYYVNPDGNQLSLGHGMCGGEFDFEDGEEYKFRFDLIDASGNCTEWKSTEISFIAPNSNDVYPGDENIEAPSGL